MRYCNEYLCNMWVYEVCVYVMLTIVMALPLLSREVVCCVTAVVEAYCSSRSREALYPGRCSGVTYATIRFEMYHGN